MSSEAANRPVHEVTFWPVRVSIWRNRTDEGRIWYSTQVSRVYKTTVKVKGREKTEWKATHALNADDLLVAAKALSEAHSYIHLQMAGDREHDEAEQAAA